MTKKRKHQFCPAGNRRFIWTIGDFKLAFPAPADPDAYYYDYEEGERWVQWFPSYLTHTEGELAGEPIELMPWNEIAIRELFGWRCVDTGYRRYQTAFWGIPRKNAKTQTGAGIGLGMITIDDEPGAQAYCISYDEEQAGLAYKMSNGMIKNNPDLAELYDVPKESAYLIEHPEENSKSLWRALPGVADGLTGLNVHYCLADEYHELKNRKIIGVMRTGMINRRQPLMHFITTAGSNKESPAHAEWKYARDVRDLKRIRDRYMPIIFEAAEGCDPFVERTWRIANPGYGYSVHAANFKEMVEEAKKGPAELDEFLQFQLNMWVERASDFLPTRAWDACKEEYDDEDLLKVPCYGGLDLGDTNDMTAFALIFPFWSPEKAINERTQKEELVLRPWYRTLNWYWVPQAAYDASLDTDHPYTNWIQHNLEVTEGDITDYSLVRERIKDLCSRFRVQMIGYDEHNATEIISALEKKDKIKAELIKILQRHNHMGDPTQRFKDLVYAQKFRHNGNDILSWNVRNAKINRDPKTARIMVVKTQSKGKVDGLHASLMGLKCAMTAPEPVLDASEHYKSEDWTL